MSESEAMRRLKEDGVHEQQRSRLKARMAGNISAGLVVKNGLSEDDVARQAVSIAEKILAELKL